MAACSADYKELVSAAADGELSNEEKATLDAHLARCPACAAALAGFLALRERFVRARMVSVPKGLEERARALADQPTSTPLVRRRWPKVAAASSLLAAAAVFALLPRGMPTALAQDLEKHHLKAFAQASPCEFQSNDPAAVQQWLQQNVGYAVAVPKVPGAELLGARRCRIGGVLTASVLFRRGGAPLTVFLPGDDAEAEKAARRLAEQEGCTTGPVGERICAASSAGHAVFAVAEADAVARLGANAFVTGAPSAP